MKNFIQESEFAFIKNGNVYFIEKDKYNCLFPFIALDEGLVNDFIKSTHKTIIFNTEGVIIMKNFGNYDLKGAQELLSEVEKSYDEKLELIDKALAEGDKDTFIQLTTELYGGIA